MSFYKANKHSLTFVKQLIYLFKIPKPLCMSSFSKYFGDFHLYENIEGDPISCNEAAVFISTKGKLYVYRSKDGDWVVGG